MTGGEAFAAECAAVDLQTGTDARGLVHVLIDDTPWPNCSYRPVDREAPTGDRVCRNCRELPGRERHARRVLGTSGPSWEARR